MSNDKSIEIGIPLEDLVHGVVPAIMPKNRADLRHKLEMVHGLVKMVQIDVMDGKFVPNRSWPYHSAGEYSDDFMPLITEEQEGLPFWDEVDFELDLMIAEPNLARIEDWVIAGAKRVVLHAGSVKDAAAMKDLITALRRKYPKGAADTISLLDICVALHIDTPLSYIEGYADQLDGVQCMGISKVGFQGQLFAQEVLEKIREVKAKYPDMLVSVDGAVNPDTATSLVEAGANQLVVGSALYESEDLRGTLYSLEAILRKD